MFNTSMTYYEGYEASISDLKILCIITSMEFKQKYKISAHYL